MINNWIIVVRKKWNYQERLWRWNQSKKKLELLDLIRDITLFTDRSACLWRALQCLNRKKKHNYSFCTRMISHKRKTTDEFHHSKSHNHFMGIISFLSMFCQTANQMWRLCEYKIIYSCYCDRYRSTWEIFTNS